VTYTDRPPDRGPQAGVSGRSTKSVGTRCSGWLSSLSLRKHACSRKACTTT